MRCGANTAQVALLGVTAFYFLNMFSVEVHEMRMAAFVSICTAVIVVDHLRCERL